MDQYDTSFRIETMGHGANCDSDADADAPSQRTTKLKQSGVNASAG